MISTSKRVWYPAASPGQPRNLRPAAVFNSLVGLKTKSFASDFLPDFAETPSPIARNNATWNCSAPGFAKNGMFPLQ